MEYQDGTLSSSSQSVISGLERSPAASAFRPSHSREDSTGTGSSRHSRQNSRDWEIMNDIQPVATVPAPILAVNVPGLCEGYMMKKRKYPLKGWHRRYFHLEKGILRYSKTHQEILRGKIHGSLEVSLAVMSINKKSKRIDLDAGHSIYHMKAKTQDMFYIWLTKLSAHRMYGKNEAMSAHQEVLKAFSSHSGTMSTMTSLSQRGRAMSIMLPQYQSMMSICSPELERPSPASTGVNGKVSAWLQQTTEADACTHELNRCELDLTELGRLIQRLHWLEGGLPITDSDLERRISMQNLTLEKPKKKSGKIFGHSRSHSHTPMFSPSYLGNTSHLGASVQSIPDYVYTQLSTPAAGSPDGKKLQQDICVLSTRVHSSLKSIQNVLTQERERLRQAWTGPELRQSTSDQLATLCSTMSELDLQARLTKIHSLSLSSESSEESFCTVRQDQPAQSAARQQEMQQHMRQLSVADSMAEYFDASEVLLDESSSENEASDESGLSDITTSNSEPEEGHASASVKYRESVSSAPDVPSAVPKNTGRRTVLPAPCADNSHIGIFSILYNNVGKDLSRISMPVALNEPVNFLQRVSEELEYSELLDIANRTDDPYERMVYVAAFSISGYAWATWRSNYKPFNPVLGETYENIRDDRGFRYVSEQVSHHPPLSACHAESENFSFWQDQRWKYKFWGKSVEIISCGNVNVTLPKYGDHYEWNKVITCIHNVFSPQRHLEHYGDVVIRNKNSDGCTCKITFVKARYWGSEGSKNEVQGTVLNAAGKVVHRFGGCWHEGIFCDTLPNPKCIWKPNTQPDDWQKFYGFSQYARELNELTPELAKVLPPTDSRFRPDQRLLEEGKLSDADKKKDEVENKQRERRKELAKKGEEHIPRFFRKQLDDAGQEVWVTNGTYWKVRKEPGFAYTDNLNLW
ncbi:oxysterol-binding protein-related protein 7-like isoform X1 [Alosa alosa]|uniref:oxysterol-binding protein-related protein 7-like isoform X1 n=2 Tax=Alosa alosa TaxID=278164 RepID=UPI0020151197|nr:oxysterol-binding protein-related protein 7-like isoform X1 [Alosa alosa]XP_048101645.1 oxysterol-binding protein-related protein 7-like isoform X1 [Alosa alosa]XP_048101646.1 oxysterol-binding protein-related protein 7-like isoform X1 [Alosa alosa]XP_048101647.1 oxysterol-binding protein-related protein 7-like isoform X1 [Alosa alosa]